MLTPKAILKTINIEVLLIKLITLGIGLTLLTPLVFYLGIPYVTPWPQAIFLRTVVEVLIVLYSALLLCNRKYLPPRSPIMFAVSFFFLWTALSSIWGIHPARSFWGTIARGEGLLTLLHIYVFFLIATAVVRDQRSWRYLMRVLVLTSVPMAIMSIFQLKGLYTLRSLDCVPGQCFRVSATFGNSGYYGSYLVLIIFAALYLAIVEEQKRWRWLAAAVAIINVPMIFLTAARSAWLAVLIGGLIVYIGWFCRLPARAYVKRFGLLLLALFLSGGLLSVYLARNAGIVKDRYALLRRFDDAVLSFVTGENSRVFPWKVALQAWTQRPVQGSGVESFLYYYDRFYDASFAKIVGEHITFDRVHNNFLETLVTGGLIGWISYMSILVFTLRVLARSRQQLWSSGALILSAMFVAHEVQNIFTFKVLGTWLGFFFLIAFVDRGGLTDRVGAGLPLLRSRVSRAGVILPLIGVMGIAWVVFNLQPFFAGRALLDSFELLRANRGKKAIERFHQAATRAPSQAVEQDLAFYYAISLANWQGFLRGNDPDLELQEKRRLFTTAELTKLMTDLEAYFDPGQRGNVLATYFFMARQYGDLYLLVGDDALLQSGLRIIKKAQLINPRHPRVYREAGRLRVLNGELDEAVRLFEYAYTLDQNAIEYLGWKSKAYILAGKSKANIAKGVQLFRSAMKLNGFYSPHGFSVAVIRHLARVYSEIEDYPAIIQFYEEALALLASQNIMPNDYRFFTDLAIAYFKAGNRPKAREIMNKTKELFPFAIDEINEMAQELNLLL